MLFLRVFAICPKCKRRIVFTPSREDLEGLKKGGIASISFNHGDHILVIFYDKDGRARGTEVHKFINNKIVSSSSLKVDELSIDDLPLNKEVKEILKMKGLYYLKDLVWFHPLRLSEYTGLSQREAERLIEFALEKYERSQSILGDYMSVSMIAKKESEKKFLHTGSKNLDSILMGGFASGEITELVGEYRTGKSQLCLTALVAAFLPPDKGGLNEGDMKAVFIDSERTFSERRIRLIFERFKIDRSFLDDILVGRPMNTIHQKKMIERLPKVARSENVKLVIVDSLTRLPRIDYKDVSELYKRQRIILEMVETLKRLSQTYNLIVLITNQVLADFSKDGGIKPIGGHVLAHSVDTRLFLEYVDEEKRKVSIMDSSWLPYNETIIAISDGGIIDPVDG